MHPFTVQSLNPAVFQLQYAVRGELAIKADALREKLKEKDNDLPFDRVISSNIGNPQQRGLDQPPITFNRQVAALMEWPALADIAPDAFPKDVVARAKELQKEIGSIGAYTHNGGLPFIRENVAKFIQDRDGFPSNPKHIFLSAGASDGVNLILYMLISSPTSGILIPIPQYPLYTASLARFRGTPLPYYLDESSDWSTSVPSIEFAIDEAYRRDISPKALVVINPGNPTGALLDESTQLRLIKLCEKYSLVLLADEVYQNNLHKPSDHPFTSFKKLVAQTQSPIPLVSFHSISKGINGECGRRGGYYECYNFPEDIITLLIKILPVGCPPLQGQIGVDLMVRPPQPGSESYFLYKQETDAIRTALASRTSIMASRLNALPGVSCVDSPGAMYLFPKILLSKTAIRAAEEAGKKPDVFYALALLDRTGVCVVPGSGFGQKEGEWHYRLTCLCPGVEEYVGKLEGFHRDWVKKYGID